LRVWMGMAGGWYGERDSREESEGMVSSKWEYIPVDINVLFRQSHWLH
jgi:hypothetical protein